MATIEKGRKLMTLVNVFSVGPAKQGELADLLVRATEETMKHLPGFVSASIHRSGDGTKVINYAQWRSVRFGYYALYDTGTLHSLTFNYQQGASAPGKSFSRATMADTVS